MEKISLNVAPTEHTLASLEALGTTLRLVLTTRSADRGQRTATIWFDVMGAYSCERTAIVVCGYDPKTDRTAEDVYYGICDGTPHEMLLEKVDEWREYRRVLAANAAQALHHAEAVCAAAGI